MRKEIKMNKEVSGKVPEKQAELIKTIRNEIGKVLVGQSRLVDSMLIALSTGGHMLVEGVPGLAKTTAVKTLSETLGLNFKRISFTPDLLPADITGTMIYSGKDTTFLPKKGPVFTNLLLADEINRAPAKVQSALLEAMQEKSVTIGDTSFNLPSPFMVMATQNPIEHEGTYPLPEAQVDRFMLKCKVDYPSRNEEKEIMKRFSVPRANSLRHLLNSDDVMSLNKGVDAVYCDDKLADYILDIVFATRDPKKFNLNMAHYIDYGASPRATLYLNMAARARALIDGRTYATPDDVKNMAGDVLRHRIILSYEAEAEDVTADDIVNMILSAVPVP